MKRRLEPEWLDELSALDPRAIRSRDDLRRINMLMMNVRTVSKKLAHAFQGCAPRSIAEIGAGDATFMLRVATKSALKNVRGLFLDRRHSVTNETRSRFTRQGWNAEFITADVFEWLESPLTGTFDLMVANLFLHHFDEITLMKLLALVAQRTRVFIACEPRRSTGALLGCRFLRILGCNDVSRHDAPVSVRAGFSSKELSSLWPASRHWALQEAPAGLFGHCFVASRIHGCVKDGEQDA